MKKLIINITSIFMGMMMLHSCEEYNPVEEIAKIGLEGPNVYWELPTASVTAGDELDFYSEYWSKDNTIQSVSVWYDVVKNLHYSITYPGNGFTFILDSTELSREFQEITSYPHNSANWNEAKHAYVLAAKIPVSYTLSSSEKKNPFVYSDEEFVKLFPEGIKVRFAEALYPNLTRAELKKLFVQDYLLVDEPTFNSYYELVFNPNTGQDEYKLLEQHITTMKGYLKAIPFSSLIYNSSKQFYSYEYSKGYKLNSRLRVVNGNKIDVFSDVKVITVN